MKPNFDQNEEDFLLPAIQMANTGFSSQNSHAEQVSDKGGSPLKKQVVVRQKPSPEKKYEESPFKIGRDSEPKPQVYTG